MIDIHNHIIFKFDDGPKSLSESLEMLRIAADQGITDVFATSHFNEIIDAEMERVYFERLEILRKECREHKINIRLHSGSEMFFHHFIHETVKKTRVATLCEQGKYILMEFPLYLMPTGVEDALYRLTMDGFIPIIAHPERYSALHSRPEKLINFVKYGGLLQVNAGSILGDFGKTTQKIALWLLESKLVHFIGSDAHGPNGRTFKLQKAATELKESLDQSYIDDLVTNNPRKIIDHISLEPMPIPESPQKPRGFVQRFRDKLKFL